MTSLAHRAGSLDLRVFRGDGSAVAEPVSAPVTVRQLTHDVSFGNIGFELMDFAISSQATGADSGAGDEASGDDDLAQSWLALFNQATLAFYWRGFEPVEDQPDTERLRTAAQWFASNGVRLKGHPLTWHTLAPQWLLGRPLGEVEDVLRERITREVNGFAGLIDEWDAINEAVIMPRFTAEENAITPLAAELGRVEMVRLAFETAREANPAAKLVINDFLLTEEYAQLIEVCLADGIEIDAIGLQTHMHQGFRGEEQLGQILERFGAFGLPLQLTETTLVSGDLMPAHIVDLNDYQVEHWPSTPEGEQRQADEIARHYRTCLEHPLVESITYWGLCDRDMWLGAPAGLLRADGTAKPSYDALQSLVHGEWWLAPTALTPGPNSTFTITGWAGDYEVECNGKRATVHLEAGAHGTADVTLLPAT